MNKSKLLCLTLLSLPNTFVLPKTDKDENQFEHFVDQVNKKVKAGIRTLAEWLEYYKNSADQELTEWAAYCRTVAPEQAEAFKSFIINEKDVAFAQLNLVQQKAIKDLNQFYHQMATATKQQQKALVQNFSARWKEIKKILKDQDIQNLRKPRK